MNRDETDDNVKDTANVSEDYSSDIFDEMYRLDTPDAELYFELVGPAGAPVIFYLHSGPGYNSHSFRELAEDELRSFRLVYADQRGAGRSLADTGADLGVEALAGDVFAILDALRIERVTLLAHGFGALIAAEAVKRVPGRIERVVLVNPWVDMPELAKTVQLAAARLAGREVSEDDLAELPPAERVAEAAQSAGGKGLFDSLFFSSTGSRMRLEHTDAELFTELQESVLTGWQDIWELTADLTPLREVPTVVIVGREDGSCYPRQAELVLSALPHALVSLLETAHYPWLDDPETFGETLAQAMQVPAKAS